jgi:hypothetical protein
VPSPLEPVRVPLSPTKCAKNSGQYQAGVAQTIACWKYNIDSVMRTLLTNDLQTKAANYVN